MSRSRRLEPAARQRAREADAAAEALARAIDGEAQERARLHQLERYEAEYLADYRAMREAGRIRPDTVRAYNDLLQRLAEAIAAQRARLAAAESELEARREAWREARGRCQAIDRTVDRLRADERRADEWREQREQDDRPARPDGNDDPR
jgi:flagellar export protein FliJ